MFTNLCAKLWVTLGNLKSDERGVTAIEYALMAAGVAVVLAAILSNTDWFTSIFAKMTGAVGESIDGINVPATGPKQL